MDSTSKPSVGCKSTRNLLRGNERGQGFKKGNHASNGGRPKGLMQLVRESTKDGKELVELSLQILRGELTVEKTYYDKEGESHTVEESPTIRDRQAALEWLADRGFGKAIDLQMDVTPDNEFRELARAYARELAAEGVRTLGRN